MDQIKETEHIPILKDKVINSLFDPLLQVPEDKLAGYLVDCTLGGAGHTSVILEKIKQIPRFKKLKVLAVDRDGSAIKRAEKRFEIERLEKKIELFHGCFSEIKTNEPVWGIFADLGVSSDQLNQRERGFSFQADFPLDMRMNSEKGETAYEWLLSASQKELEEVLLNYGEERYFRRIAQCIIKARDKRQLPENASDIAKLIGSAVPSSYRYGRIHPATRSFQALRIVVNKELEELDSFLRDVILLLRPKARVAVLTFHSLEDRKVKTRFRQLSKEPQINEGAWMLTFKKPIIADEVETKNNPRARSAKLRVIERTS